MKRTTPQLVGAALRFLASATASVVLLGALSAFAQAPAPAAAKEPEKPKGWESTAAAGLSLTSGNSESYLATLTINSVRKWEKNEALLGGSAGYGETKDQDTGNTSKTQDLLGGFAQWNHLFTERIYAGLRADAIHDSVADIEYRLSISPIFGYYFIKAPRTSLSGEAGPSFLYENRGGEKKGYVGLRLAERFEHKFDDRSRIWQTLEYIPQVDDFNNYLVNFEIGASTRITKSVGLRAVLQDNFVNQPAPGRRQNDLKLMAGLDYTF